MSRSSTSPAPSPAAWLALLLGLVVSGLAQADQMKFARYQLQREAGADRYLLEVQLQGSVKADEQLWLPPQCQLLSEEREALAGRTLLAIRFHCQGPLRAGDQLAAPWGEDGGVLTSTLKPGGATPTMLHGSAEGIVIPLDSGVAQARPLARVASEYVGLGIVHILEGLDHLSFVLCLCLLSGGATLLYLVTAFTLGHSISLALSYLGVVSIPAPPVEATIALSIAFMAREALLARRANSDSRAARLRYMAVVASFGLLHGLGFASVLGELGVSPSERIAGLVFFNVGVECGQLLFVAAVSALLWLARRAGVQAPLRLAALHGVGSLGMYWTLQRLTGFVLAA